LQQHTNISKLQYCSTSPYRRGGGEVVAGNVLTVFSDKKHTLSNNHTTPYIVSTTDYDPFGMIMNGRNWNAGEYRFAFNGQEKTDEVSGVGNHLDFKYRGYDPLTGRFWSVDPLFKDYPWNSTYAFAENRVIDGIDLEGREYKDATGKGLGPITPEAAEKAGATLYDTDNKPVEKQNSLIDLGKKTAEFLKKNNISPQNLKNQGEIRSPEIPADIQMGKQIGEGVAIGLSSEITGYGIGYGVKAIGNISIPIYRTFGGASRAVGEYWSPFVNTPMFYGRNYASAAGLPEFNSGAFIIKASTPLSNLELNTFKLTSKMGSNRGGFLTEIQVIQKDAIRVKNIATFEFPNPTYNPNWYLKNHFNSNGQLIKVLNQ